MKNTYNLAKIMNKAWELFRATGNTFAECLVQAWAEAKAFVQAINEAGVTEEVHTWYVWKLMGYEVEHGSKNVFQITVADPKTKTGKRVISFFTKSQVHMITE